MRHELKVRPAFFEPMRKREKRFELRRGRDFSVGDELLLREWAATCDENGKEVSGVYTGREMLADVTYVLSGKQPIVRIFMPEIPEDISILSIRVWMIGQDLDHMVRRNRQ